MTRTQRKGNHSRIAKLKVDMMAGILTKYHFGENEYTTEVSARIFPPKYYGELKKELEEFGFKVKMQRKGNVYKYHLKHIEVKKK